MVRQSYQLLGRLNTQEESFGSSFSRVIKPATIHVSSLLVYVVLLWPVGAGQEAGTMTDKRQIVVLYLTV